MIVWKPWGQWEYVNRGTDPRVGGWLGQLLAMIQTLGSFHSTTPPKRFGGKYAAVFWPPFLGIAIPYDKSDVEKRYATFRAGWRWDVNWPGYILDVIVKLAHPAVPFCLSLLIVTSCGKKAPNTQPPITRVETVTVEVPVPTKVPPPPELLLPIKPPLPLFVPPSHPEATSALTAEGERLLRGMIEDFMTRIRAWEAWASGQ